MMIKPCWLVNGIFIVIALVLIAIDVHQRHDEIELNKLDVTKQLTTEHSADN